MIKKIVILLGVFLLPQITNAHVRYLVDDETVKENSGIDLQFFLQPLTEISNILLIIATIVAVLVIFFLFKKVFMLKKITNGMCDRADGYEVFIPWILRLSAGIALIGSGVTGTLISPVIDVPSGIASLQIFLGFMLMAGFLVVPAALVSLFLYLLAFQVDWYILGNLDFFAMVLALLVVDNERPGIDDLLGIPHFSPFKSLKKFAPLIIRIGIGGAMMFLAVYEKLLNPHISEIVVNDFGLMNVVSVSPEMWIFSAGIIEFLIGLALLIGFKTRLMSAVAFAVLSLSFFYFGEEVTSHITLFGSLSILFITQGGKFSFDKKC